MHPFLKALSAHIVELPTPLGDQVVVLPTRRAAYHLKRLFAEDLNYQGWLPRFATLNEFLAEVAGVENADPIDRKFTCYEAYAEVMGADAQGLSAFFSWADALIDDFNEIESQAILPEIIFRELTDYSELEHFSFLETPLNAKQERYLKFWRALKDIHARFNTLLLSQKRSYPGLTSRLAVKGWSRYAQIHPELYVTLAGFSALSKSEIAFAQMLESEGRGKVFYDADPFYLDDLQNPAGFFLRNNLRKKVGEAMLPAQPMAGRAVEITYSAAPNKIAQADAVAAIVASLPPESLQHTAVVLADESMLLPLLHRLPDTVKEANVTMGIPVSQSPFADWIEKLFAMQSRIIGEAPAHMAPSQRVKSLAQHPFALLLAPAGQAVPLPDMRALYCPLNAYRQAVANAGITWLEPLIDCWNNGATKAISSLHLFAEKAGMQLDAQENGSLEARLAAKGIDTLKRLLRKLKDRSEAVELDLNALLALVKSAMGAQRVDLLGEPAHGLQIMGLLETRALGYKRVILCDVNEDMLPGNAHVESFIPFDIRNFHKMPGKREKEAVYAYHFFRLMQSADHMHLVYHTDMSGPWSAERSRFVEQIAHYLAEKMPELSFCEWPIEEAPPIVDHKAPALEKSPEVLAHIRHYIENRVSASGINRYFESPLEWYYGNVLRLAEPQEEGEISDADFGSLIHGALEDLYKPYASGHLFAADDLKDMQSKTETVLRARFDQNNRIAQYAQGINRLHFEGAMAMVNAYLRNETMAIAKGDRVEMVATEKKLHRSLRFSHGENEVVAQFTGSADLVTIRNGTVRVTDFKTGMVKSEDLSLSNIGLASFAKKPKALQLMLYGWLVLPEFPGQKIEGQILSLPKPGDRNLLLKKRIDEDDHAAQFEGVLAEMFIDMLDAEKPLASNPDFKFSVYEPA